MQQYFAIILLLNVRVVDIPLALIIAEIVVIIPSDLLLHMALLLVILSPYRQLTRRGRRERYIVYLGSSEL